MLVVCPRCAARAVVRRLDGAERRPAPGAAMSMLEGLPDWMTSAKNRDDVLAVLDRLQSHAVSAE